MKPELFHRHPRGFTFIELLVVLTVLFVLFGTLFSGYHQSHRRNPKMSRCVINLKTLGVATLMYTSDHAGLLPWQKHSIAGQTNSGRKLIFPNLSARQYLDRFTNYTGNSPRHLICPADMERSQNVDANQPGAGNQGISYFVGLNEYLDHANAPMLGDRNISSASGQPLYASAEGKAVLVDTNTLVWGTVIGNEFHEGEGAFSFTDGHVEVDRSPRVLLSYATKVGVTNANLFLFPQ